ncbi:MAG: tRNA (adenosine(37)-N6)-dimethylallyltransferase MiaA [Bacteroidales bacterium]|jgi:tRNA dimethylallyltransferase|nr:tRNA (adenosine(37)-N6)-dimethylallyltransferase MiaA [Bacteroidales bacterium]MDD4058269.1 tRNA (adenosine(37)-N6)-dimethylallyltransferase MiaA [Bacteroidales bacterium]
MNQDLICILGPTASGKTRYAVNMALERGGEIISADSRQVYRGMDIGTGKDLSEYEVDGVKVPYHLIDIAEPGSKYNIFQYQKDFRAVYDSILFRGRQPILCGGSGLYIESVTMGYNLAEVPPNSELRERLEALPMGELIEMLKSYKQLHNTTDIDSKKRAIRALEIAIFDANNNVERSVNPKINTRFIGIDISREERIRRIDKRLDERLEQGMVEEVQRLLNSGIDSEDLIYYGLEYKFVTLYILGRLTFDEMRRLLATAIHQFAKRQMTWFRGMERRGIVIEWVKN